MVAPTVPGCTETDRAAPFEVLRCPGGSHLLPGALALALPQLVRSRQLDAVFHAQWQTLAISTWLKRRSALQRVFVAAHGRELWLRPFGKLPLLQRRYDAVRTGLLRHADGVFAVSAFSRTHALREGALPERTFVVGNGTDPERFFPVDAEPLRRHLGLHGARVLLFAGRLAHNKGVDTAIAAMPHILREVPDAVLLIAGQGPDRTRLEGLVHHHNVARQVRFVGRVPDDALPTYYSLADVFVTLSREEPPAVEGFGIVFLEAGACGTAVIGARSGGIPDAVQDGTTGLLVAPGDPLGYAQAACRLLIDSNLRRQLGDAGRQHVLACGNWDAAHACLNGHFKRILGEAAPA